MPESEGRGGWWDDREGHPLDRHEGEWLKGEVSWTRSEFQTLVGWPADVEQRLPSSRERAPVTLAVQPQLGAVMARCRPQLHQVA